MGAVLSKLRVSESGDGKDPIIPRTKSQFQRRYLPTVKQLCIAGGFFIAFQLLGEGVYPAILKKSPEFNSLSAVRQRHTPLYINSTIHALLLSVVGAYKLARQHFGPRVTIHDASLEDANPATAVKGEGAAGAEAEGAVVPRTASQAPQGTLAKVLHFLDKTLTCRNVLLVSLGYFASDFWATRSEWMEYKSNFLHHILGFVMCNAGLVVIPEHHEPLISRFFVIETSTVCLDIMWLLRAFNREATLAYAVAQNSFLTLFLSLRVVMLPWTVVNMRRTHEEEWKGLGVLGRSSVLAISGLQWYWAYKIVQKFLLL